GDDIEVYQLTYQGTPCYRYKMIMPGANGIGLDDNSSTIAVDIAADAITAVNMKMYIYIGVGICASMLLVVFVSARFTNKITKPLNILVRDMSIVAKGDLSHRTKPHSDDEIGVLAHAFNKMTSNLKTAQEAMVEQEKAAYEMNLAHEVQQQLLPQALPKLANYEIASFYDGAKAVSGDYFDFIPLGEGIWGFIIADVSGKGIPGSMVMAQCRTVVRLVANQYPDRASETLKKTNRLLAKQIKRGMFVTAFYAILNENTGEITYSSAGHNPLIIYRAATQSYELATPKGIAIGFNEGPLFDKNIQEESATLQPGDSFILYTDGFPEAMNADEEEFGDDEFYEVVANAGHLPVGQMKDNIVQAIAEHRGAADQSDDLTLIAVKWKT
ncbi:MAG: SpoIIE family protein phosphatase, partial [Planctomycetes bacterium]|nr:SpoIIE family protein phosphatase [Planctomycetota bacterium]